MAKKAKKAAAKPAETENNAASKGPALAKVAEAEKISAPLVNSSSMQLVVAGNDVTIIFLRSRPITTNGRGELGLAVEPVTMVQMSPQALKDLSIVLGNAVVNYEKEWGEIESEYTRRQAAKH